jgi:YD repeat-containing protein
MKQLAFLLLVAVMAVSCKKDGQDRPKEKLLSRIIENDIVVFEFEYDANNRLHKHKKFLFGSNTASVVYTYEYDSKGQLSQMIRTDASNTALEKTIYEYSTNGNLIKSTSIDHNGADSGEYTYHRAYIYGTGKRVIRINSYLGDFTPAGYVTFEYFDNGAISVRREYAEKVGGSTLMNEYESVGSGNRVHPSIKRAYVFPGDKEFEYYDADVIWFSVYEDGAVGDKWKNTMSQRKYEAGLLTAQRIGFQKTLPVLNPVVQYLDYKYEYVEQ